MPPEPARTQPIRSPVAALRGAFAPVAGACTAFALIVPGVAQAQATGPDAPFFWDDADGDNQPEVDENRPDPDLPTVEDFGLAADADPDRIAFEAETLNYDDDSQVVTANGNVLVRRGDQAVRADEMHWDRVSGDIVATGNVQAIDETGNLIYTDRLTLTEELRAGAIDNLLLVLAEGGRLASNSGIRDEEGRLALTESAFSPCAIVNPAGCPKTPSWRITADAVTFDPATEKVDLKGARLELFGLSLLPLPGMGLATHDRAISGITSPDLGYSDANGIEVSGGYYFRLAPNREMTLGATVYTEVLPMLTGRYRVLTGNGAYQVSAYATSSSRIPIGGDVVADEKEAFRGYLDGNGRIQLDPNWSVTGSLRYSTDRTFLRRYDISRDDRLRSTIQVDRVDDASYLSMVGWASQTMRIGEDQGLVPLALPLIDYRRRLEDPLLGGRVMLQANSLALTRAEGQDTQRAFAGATWEVRRLTGLGQEITATARLRADAYHTDQSALTTVALYRGEDGWHARGVAVGAIDAKWPLIGRMFGGEQVLIPRLQLVATPDTKNLSIPNEDARAADLEDSNLFALNRFAGYDRVEEGVRMTYGVDWQWQRPGWRADFNIGQSYRLSNQRNLLPDGTGLTSRTSDIVGRNRLRYRDFLQLTHRYRLDKDNLTPRRNEFDVAVGSSETYVEAGYLKLDRDIPGLLEDLRDREELRLAGRVAFANYWSVFGSTVINLTDASEDPTLTSDGFDPLRTRLGVAYDDDCLEIAFTWRRDDRAAGDAREGNTFLFRFRLKGFGVR